MIVDLQLEHLRALLEEKNMKLEVTDAAKDALAEQGFDPQLGARPIKRVIQQKVQNALAMKLLKGEFKEGDTIFVDQKDGAMTFSKG